MSTTRPESNATICPSDLIDDYIFDRVDFRVAEVAEAYGLQPHDQDDLRQRLLLAICAAAHRYDPSKAKPRTFVRGVLNLEVANYKRSVAIERRSTVRSPIMLSELQRNGRSFSPLAHHRYEQRSHDLVLDLRAGFSRLDREQQILAEALKKQRPAEIADESGVHRSTVYRNIAAIRDSFDAIGLSPIE